ncbi:hypothetical protein ABZ927_31545 [Streptomyces massasporeus]
MYWLTWRSSSPRACLSQGARCPPTGSNTGRRCSISRFGSFTESLPPVAQPFETWRGRPPGSGRDDELYGGPGRDTLSGGPGRNVVRQD